MEEINYFDKRLKDVTKNKLLTEVFIAALRAMKENPSLEVEEALECGCEEWDV